MARIAGVDLPKNKPVEYGLVRGAEIDGYGVAIDFRIHQQARPPSSLIEVLDAHHHTVSFTSTPGRWHMGSGFDWVCRSVPRSNLRGSCLA